MVDVTNAMRKAVYLDDCLREGHQFDFNNVISSDVIDARAGRKSIIKQALDSGDAFRLPHIRCSRCGGTWIVPPSMGTDYNDAERILYDWIKPDHPLAKIIVRLRGGRNGNGKSTNSNP